MSNNYVSKAGPHYEFSIACMKPFTKDIEMVTKSLGRTLSAFRTLSNIFNFDLHILQQAEAKTPN